MATGANADSKYIWMDGKLVPYANAQVHLLSHSLHYGCGVFEGIRAYETRSGKTQLFQGEAHLKRFQESCKVLGYTLRHSVSDLLQACHEVIAANEFKECYVRPVAYINDTVRGLKLPQNPEVHTAIAVWPWGKYMGDKGHSQGVKVKISTFRRPDVSSSLPLAKISGNYVTSVMARREATLEGFDEAILLDPNGFVAEGSGENIFIVKNGRLSTPPIGYLLPGITRSSVLEIARELGYTVHEENITRNQLYVADEVFFTGTAVEVTPIREIDHQTIGNGEPGPVTQKIKDLFFKCTRGEADKFSKWLD